MINTEIENYESISNSIIENYYTSHCKISIKVPFLYLYLNKFPKNLADIIEEQGERFHQVIIEMERRYQER